MSNTTVDKLNYLSETKDAIKQAIVNKGVTVDDSTTFREYADKIGSIEGGGSCPVTLVDTFAGNGSGVFDFGYLIKTLDLSDVNITGITSLSKAFYDHCRETESIIFPSTFDTSNVTNMSLAFANCNNLKTLDLSNWNFSKVTGTGYDFSEVGLNQMFIGCESLTSITFPSTVYPNNGDVSAYQMFCRCESLLSLDLSGWNASNFVNMGSMFSNCTSLTSLNLSNWNTSNVTNMSAMFSFCSSLTSLDLSSFDTSNVTDMSTMFNSCRSLTSLNLSSWNTSNVTYMSSMFSDISGWKAEPINITFGNNWASNDAVTSLDFSTCDLTHDSCLDLFNKLATKSSSATLKLSDTTKDYMSEEEIAIATGKGWTVA